MGHVPLSPYWFVLAFAGLAAGAGGYVCAWRLRRAKTAPDGGAVGWITGLLAAFVAFHPTLVSLGMEGSHLAFMVQMEALTSIAPPLLILGLSPFAKPGTGRGRPRSAVLVLASACWLGTAYLWHLPPVHEAAMGSQGLYALQLVLFLAAGLFFWWPVLGGNGMGTMGGLVYLAVAQAGMAALAAVLIWSPSVLYGHGGHAPGLPALTDQRLAGVVMVVLDMTVASAVAGWLFLREPDPAPGGGGA